MKTQTFFKLVFAIILVLQVEQINFSQNNQARTISFERNAQVDTSVKVIKASFEAAASGTSPSIAKASSGAFMIAYQLSTGVIAVNTMSAAGQLGTAANIVAAPASGSQQNPSIAMLIGGSYILCYSITTTAPAYSTKCIDFSSTQSVGTISIADAFGTQAAASYPSVYGLSDGKYGILIHDGATLKSAVGSTSSPTTNTIASSLIAGTSPAQMVEFTSSSVAKVAIVYMSSTLKVSLAVTTLANFIASNTVYTSVPFDLVTITAASTTATQPSIVVLSNGKLYIAYVETVSATSNTIKYVICPASVTKAGDCTTAAALTDSTVSGMLDCQYPRGTLLSNGQAFLTASCASTFNGDFVLYGILLDSAGAAVTNGKFTIASTGSTDYINGNIILSSTNVGIIATTGSKAYAAIYQEIALSTSGQLLNQVISLATLSVALLFLLLL